MTPIRRQFVKNLKKIRKAKGLTQEQLAEKLDITVRYIQRLEGNNCPDVGLDALGRLAKALSVKPFVLIEE